MGSGDSLLVTVSVSVVPVGTVAVGDCGWFAAPLSVPLHALSTIADAPAMAAVRILRDVGLEADVNTVIPSTLSECYESLYAFQFRQKTGDLRRVSHYSGDEEVRP